jgi:hypothetical protein
MGLNEGMGDTPAGRLICWPRDDELAKDVPATPEIEGCMSTRLLCTNGSLVIAGVDDECHCIRSEAFKCTASCGAHSVETQQMWDDKSKSMP